MTTAPVKAEFVSHEVTPQGGIKLNWNIPQSTQFVVFRNGIPVSGNVNTQTWTDTAPLPSASGNQYVLYVNYIDDEGNSFWTWSSTYVVQKPIAAAAASSIDAFWTEYDSVTVDEVLTNIV
ncbi:hypothetical protein FACS18942_03200 [Planctomycetales bacterium]|nr:hypothetical protein FACS18942_03200 [Planctomycetales bacterium]